MRKFIFKIIEPADNGNKLSRIYDFIMMDIDWFIKHDVFATFFFFFLFRAAPVACGRSQAGVAWELQLPACTTATAASATYTAAPGNAESFTHGARPGMEPASSRILVGGLTH